MEKNSNKTNFKSEECLNGSKQVIRLIKSGQIEGHQVGKLFRVSSRSVQDYLKEVSLSN